MKGVMIMSYYEIINEFISVGSKDVSTELIFLTEINHYL